MMVTMLVTNLNVTEEAYDEYLDYELVSQGVVDESLAEVWGAEGMVGHPYIVMQPSSGEPVYLRFIEEEEKMNYRPMGTHGWNSTEILVQNPDQLATELESSPFEIIGMPYDLYPTPDAPRAMQVLGPSDEVLYLTRIIPEGSGFNLGSAQSYVDRVFIMVLGGPSMEALQDYYKTSFGMPVTEASDWTIGVLSRMNDLPDDSVFPLALVEFEENFLIELDEWNNGDIFESREVKEGHLPPSTSMVSFSTTSIDQINVEWKHEPQQIDVFPYNGSKVGVTVGIAGEWIEIIEWE
jgi:hypothetical protein